MLVAWEKPACTVVFCHKDDINSLFSSLSLNMAENTEVQLDVTHGCSLHYTGLEALLSFMEIASVQSSASCPCRPA